MALPLPQYPDPDSYDKPESSTEFSSPSRFRTLMTKIAAQPKWLLGVIAVVVIGLVGLMLHKPAQAPVAMPVATPGVTMTPTPMTRVPPAAMTPAKHKGKAMSKKSSASKKSTAAKKTKKARAKR